MNKKINGYAKWVAVIITIITMFSGIVWNAAILSNDVKHIKKDILEIKLIIKEIRQNQSQSG